MWHANLFVCKHPITSYKTSQTDTIESLLLQPQVIAIRPAGILLTSVAQTHSNIKFTSQCYGGFITYLLPGTQ